MARKMRLKNPFQEGTGAISLAKISALVAVNTNLQVNVLVDEFTSDLNTLLAGSGKKVVVHEITPSANKYGIFRVVIKPGDSPLEFRGHTRETFAAGGAANITNIWAQYGVENQLLLTALGSGRSMRMLSGLLKQSRVPLAQLLGKSTNYTLCVTERGTGRTILLCEKNPYELPEQTGEYLALGDPELLALVSLRPDDLPLVRQMLVAIPAGTRTKRAFMPHPDLLRDPVGLAEFRKILKGADLLQVNLEEAMLLTGQSIVGLEIKNQSDAHRLGRELALKISDYGVQLVVVTLHEFGSATAFKKGSRIELFLQAGFKTKAKDKAGAGDAHFATLVYYLWLYNSGGKRGGVSLEKSLAMASYVAARKCAHEGPTKVPSQERRENALRGKKTGVIDDA